MFHLKHIGIYIGLICIATAGACLLWAINQSNAVSYRKNSAQMASPAAIPNVLINTASSSLSLPVSTADIHFEVVKDTVAQEKGLGGRKNIPDNYGMLFVFPKDASYGFWMKDMLTPIDMIWVTDTGTIIGIASDVLPSTYPNVFYPPGPVRFVIETKVGLAAEKKWTVGIRLALPASALLPD